jgi:hypothetical protein
MTSIMLGGGLFFKYELPFMPSAALILRGGGGLDFLDIKDLLDIKYKVYDSSSSSSIVNYYYYGAALRFDLFYKIFMELGANYQSVFMNPNNINSIKAFAKFGIYLF